MGYSPPPPPRRIEGYFRGAPVYSDDPALPVLLESDDFLGFWRITHTNNTKSVGSICEYCGKKSQELSCPYCGAAK